MDLSKAERDVIEAAAHMDRFGWNLCTSRSIRKRDADRAVERGLLADGGIVHIVDGDGFALQPERFRSSYILTPLGREAVAQIEREQKEEWAKWEAEYNAKQAA